jgi:hypothetical protein
MDTHNRERVRAQFRLGADGTAKALEAGTEICGDLQGDDLVSE